MYRIGQFRRPQLDSYSIPLQVSLSEQTVPDIISRDIFFKDICGNLTGANIMNNKNSYYLRFQVKQKTDSEQRFYLKIRNTTETEDNEQLIEEYKVARGNGITYFEVILSPNATYNQIVWELQRTIIDYQTTTPRIMEVIVDSYTQLIDILPVLKTTYVDMEYLTKIGVQGPPSLLMCINKEQIRIGKNGIYEINNNNINITSISFVPKQTPNGLDYFIMDFEY